MYETVLVFGGHGNAFRRPLLDPLSASVKVKGAPSPFNQMTRMKILFRIVLVIEFRTKQFIVSLILWKFKIRAKL